MNKHVQSMKNALVDYQKAVKAAIAKMEENSSIYQPAEAEKANAAVMENLSKAKQTAKDSISAAMEAGRSEADAWGQLDGAKITEDARLLESEAVNPEQFKGLVKKYQDNSTMLQLLTRYAEKQNAGRGGFSAAWNYDGKGKADRDAWYFDTSEIPTIEDKHTTYDSYAETANNLIEQLGSTEKGKMGMGPDSPMLAAAIDGFGE